MSLHIDSPHAPLEPLHLPQIQHKKIDLFLKREDQSHPFISGNKWRKLKYHLLAARQQNKNLLVTFGGAYSNHLLATAAAGAKYQFATHGFVRGEEVSNHMLKLCLLFGMKLQFVSRTAYLQKEDLFQNYFGSNQHAFYIPEGGSGNLGEQGVSEILDEADMQHFDAIIASVGTGGTLKGLLQGVQKHQLNTRVHGIVVLKGAEAMNQEYVAYAAESYCLHHQFHGGGYAKTNEALHTFQHKFASQTGIILDPVYEAKMMFGLISLIEQNYFAPGTRICALHNGGLLGVLSR